MANYNNLKQAIQQVIKTNGNNEITGALLQQSLLSMINSLGAGYQYMGIATPSTNPGTTDTKIFYMAATPGTYSNMGSGILSNGEIAVFYYDSSWNKATLMIVATPNDLVNKVSVATGKNLLNPDTLFVNKYINKNNGSVATASGFWATDFIPVNGQNVYCNVGYTGGAAIGAAVYDSNKNYLRASGYRAYTYQQGDAYVRFTINTLTNAQIEYGTTGTPYEPYSPIAGYPIVIPNGSITNEQLKESYVFVKRGKNIFTRENERLGWFIMANGSLGSGENYTVTDYLQVEPNTNYYYSVAELNVYPGSSGYINFYDENKNLLSTTTSRSRSFTTPNNCKFIRVTYEWQQSSWQNVMIEQGTSRGGYEPYSPIGGYPIIISDNSIGTEKIIDMAITNAKILDKTISIGKLKDTELVGISDNIFSPDFILLGNNRYINSQDGTIGSFTDSRIYGITDYIPISQSGLHTNCIFVGGAAIGGAYYGANKNYISGIRGETMAYVENAAFVRFTILSTVDNKMLSIGTEQKPYVPYQGLKYIISKSVLPNFETGQETIDISLPDKIYAVVGDTLQMFFRGIIKAVDPYKYDILIACSKGNKYPRYFEYTPKTTDIGTTTLTITVKDNNRKQLATKTCSLITVAALTSPTSMKHIACFGDSLTSAGVWCEEACRRLIGTGGTPGGLGLSNIAFVGQMHNNLANYFGVGGWSWVDYTTQGRPAFRFQVSGVSGLTIGAVYTNNGHNYTIQEINVTAGIGNILCSVSATTDVPQVSGVLTKVSGTGDATITFSSYSTDSQNPLWDYEQNKMTFTNYVNTYCGGQLDVVCTLLSWNNLGGLVGSITFDSVISKIKIFADTLHAEYPNAKFKLMGIQVPDVRGGMGSAYGATGSGYADQYGMVVTALNLNKAYQDFANSTETSGTSGDAYNTFVEFINVSSQFDTEYNMPYSDKPVNTRNTTNVEMVGTNGVHPATRGYYQIGDVLFRNLCKSLA